MTIDEKVLHLHIPKVGGTTLRRVLYEQYAVEEEFRGEDRYFVSGIYYFPWGVLAPPEMVVAEQVRQTLGRQDLRAVLGHFYYGIHPYVAGPSTYITLLRDPADRLVSLYFLLVTLPVKYEVPPGMTFHQFVTTDLYREAFNDQTRRIAGREPGVGLGDSQVLIEAKEHLKRDFSVVGTMERFEETLILLKRRLNWQKEISYYPARQNPDRPLVTSIPRRTLDVIHERNAADYELYDFANDLMNEAVRTAGPDFDTEVGAVQEFLLAHYEKLGIQRASERRKKGVAPADGILQSRLGGRYE